MPAVVIFVNTEYLSVVLTKETETLIVTVTNKTDPGEFKRKLKLQLHQLCDIPSSD